MSECVLPDFYNWSEPVALKRHLCCECCAPILKGEQHFRCTGKWEGHVGTHRQHYACLEACMMIRDNFNGGECIGFGELFDFWDSEMKSYKAKHRTGEWWPKLRHLIAVIKWRERKAV